MTKNDDDLTIKILRDQGFEPIVEGGRYETVDEVYAALADLVDNIESHSERCDCDLCELNRQLERMIPDSPVLAEKSKAVKKKFPFGTLLLD